MTFDPVHNDPASQVEFYIRMPLTVPTKLALQPFTKLIPELATDAVRLGLVLCAALFPTLKRVETWGYRKASLCAAISATRSSNRNRTSIS